MFQCKGMRRVPFQTTYGDGLGMWVLVTGTKPHAKLGQAIGSKSSGPVPLHPGQKGGKYLNLGPRALASAFVPRLKPKIYKVPVQGLWVGVPSHWTQIMPSHSKAGVGDVGNVTVDPRVARID